MLFSSSTFIFIFLPIVLFVYFLIPNKFIGLKNITLFAFSLVFYAYGEPKFVFVMLGTIICNYFFGLLISKKKNKKLVLGIGVGVNIFIIFIFKYLNFTVLNINRLLMLLSIDITITQTEILLPIGISFFTFQAISYLIDVYRNGTLAQKNPMYLGLYISFFPQLIAGPIVRYTEINQAINNRVVTFDNFNYGIKRFVFGLAKKVIISNSMALISDTIWEVVGGENSISALTAWLGAIAYTLQIYFDFSGYSDMAIGLGKMFGFSFNENFNYPYISKSISEFWRRWHISLGSWFRDYVYFPMGGSRVSSKKKLLLNLFVVWALTGIWHGANWTFIAWGLMHFCLISFEKISAIPERLNTVGKFTYQIIVLICIIIGWVIFRSEDIGIAADYISSMFGLAENGLIDIVFVEQLHENIVLLLLGIIASTPLLNKSLAHITNKNVFIGEFVEIIVGMTLFVISISQLVLQSYNPFIYFNF